MVTIPGPEQVQRTSALSTRAGSVRASAADFGAGVGEALQRGAGQALVVLEDLGRKEDTRKLNEARTGAYAALKQVEFDLDGRDDYEAFEREYDVQRAAIKEQFSQGLSGDALEAFNLAFDQSSATVGLNVQGMARSGIRKRGADSFTSNLSQLRETMANAGNDAEFALGFDLAREMLASGVEAGYFNQQAGQEALDKWTNGVRRDQANRIIVNDPELAVEVLEADDLDGLQESDRLTLLKQAKVQVRILDAERRRQEAERRAILRGRVSGALKDEIASIRRAGMGQGLVSAEEIRAAYEPEEAEAILRQMDEEVAFYETRQRIALTPISEDRAILEAAAPSGEGFAVEAERQDLLIEAVREKRKALATDPAGYLFQISPAMAATFQAAEEPQEMRAAIESMLAEQERLGVPRHGRRAFSKAQAAQLVADFAGQEDAQGRADWVRAQAEVYGDHWPRVYGEMVDAGLPGGAMVLAGMTGPGQARAAQALAEAQQEGAKALKDAIGKEDAGLVDEAVRVELAAFDRTLALTPGGGQIANLYRDQITTLAYAYRRQGMDATTASEKAAADVVNGQYTFHDTYRVPVDAGVDPDEVELRVRNFQHTGLADLDLALPPSLDERLPEEEIKRQYVSNLATYGYWVTNQDETGLLLFDQQGRTVMRRDGEPVEVLFTDLPSLPAPSTNPDFPVPSL